MQEQWRNLENWQQLAAELFAIFLIGIIGTWLINKFSRYYVMRLDAKQHTSGVTGQLQIRRRDTQQRVIVALMRVGLYVALAIAAMHFLFPQQSSLLLGTTLALAITGFALQPYLRDIIAGTAMLAENWFEIGDTVYVEPIQISGVVEHFNLRSTTLRSLSGEKVTIHNSAIYSVSVARRGVKDFRLELYVRDLQSGRELVSTVANLLPSKQTHVVKGLELIEEETNGSLHQLTCSITVPSERAWIAEELVGKLLHEQDQEQYPAKVVIVHGPVVYNADPIAEQRLRQSIIG
jgi:hypothetical protein